MIQSLLTKYIYKKVTENPHPVLNIEGCINKKQKKIKCKNCIEVCKEGVFEEGSLDFDKCNNCNICVSVCKSRCINSNYDKVVEYYNLLLTEDDIIYIGCDKNNKEYTYTVQCLASIPYEFLILLMAKKRVILDIDSCSSCEDVEHFKVLEHNLTKLVESVSLENLKDILDFTLNEDEEGLEDEELYSRREVLALLFNKSKDSAVSILPKAIKDEEVSGLIYRKMVNKLINSEEKTNISSINLTLPSFKDDCYGCGICEKICPNGAIKIKAEDDNKDNIIVEVNPLKCTHCGCCKEICMEKAIEYKSFKDIKDLTKNFKSQKTVKRCEECSRPLRRSYQNNICVGCKQYK